MDPVSPDWMIEMIDGLLGIVDVLLPLVITLGVLAFFWGIVQFILHADEPKARAIGKSFMIWGVIMVFVMISTLGLIELLGSLFGVDQGGSMPIPTYTTIPTL